MQGQALRDSADEFAKRNCVVLGASFDTPDENAAFRMAQRFPFALLSDSARSVGSVYGVVRSGGPYADYPNRYSFLIDPEGIIRRSYDVDNVAEHAGVVLSDLDELQA